MIFFAILITMLCIYMACNKTENIDPASAIPTTTEVSDGTTLVTIPETNPGAIQLRNCTGCSTCCCVLTATAPSNATVNVGFCSSVFPSCGFLGCGCTLGNGTTCGSGVGSGSNGDDADLQVGVMDEDFKQWCAGDSTVLLVITNNESITVSYTLDCGGTPLPFSLMGLESALIRKNGSCTPSVQCKY